MFADIRESDELQKAGTVQGAVHVPRGLVEFRANPNSPTHKPELGDGNKLVRYAAPTAGLR